MEFMTAEIYLGSIAIPLLYIFLIQNRPYEKIIYSLAFIDHKFERFKLLIGRIFVAFLKKIK
jgi:hypothetical protein